MKKTHKKLFGLFGLGVVAATTAVALAMPNNPDALATATSTSFTDTISVRVVGSEVDATITEPLGDPTTVMPGQEIAFDYSGADTVTAYLEYTTKAGNKYTYFLANISAGQVPGGWTDTLDLANYGLGYPDYDHGYGDYTLIVISTTGSITDEDRATFSYLPVVGDAEQKDDTNVVNVNLEYDVTDASIIETVVLNVYDENGDLVKTVTVDYPTEAVEIDFGDLSDCNYKITAMAYDGEGQLYKEYTMQVDYKAPSGEDKKVVPVPNTGGIFKNSNISQTDYLITGLIIFGVVAIAGIVFMMRNDKKTPTTKKTGRRK